MKKIIYVLCLFALSSCEKPQNKFIEKAELMPKITSTCSLNSLGKAECTFKNSGNVKGTSCEYVALLPKEGKKPIYIKLYKSVHQIIIASKNLLKVTNAELAPKKVDVASTILNDSFLLNATIMSLWSEKVIISSNEMCSGIVEAGDIRQVTNTIRFFDYTPAGFCDSYNGAGDWMEQCSFTTISRDDIFSMLKEELKKI